MNPNVIHIRCPVCRQRYDAPAHFAGRQAKCPNCGGVMTIPSSPPPPKTPTIPYATPTSPWHQKKYAVVAACGLALAMGLFLMVVRAAVTSVPLTMSADLTPSEQDYFDDLSRWREAYLTSDHNKSLYYLLMDMSNRGYIYNRSTKLLNLNTIDDIRASLSGWRLISPPPSDYPYRFEWTLNIVQGAIADPPKCTLELSADERYSHKVHNAFLDEWFRMVFRHFPSDFYNDTRVFLADILRAFRADQKGDQSAALLALETRTLVDRGLPDGDSGWQQYYLQVKDTIGDYLVEIDLRDTETTDIGPWSRLTFEFTYQGH